MEEAELLSEQEKQELHSDRIFGFLGFTIYDVFHIVFAAIFLILAYVNRGSTWQMEAAECMVELSFSILLIAFIVSMVKHHEGAAKFRRFYTFAWLSASAALFVPLSFELPEIVAEGFGRTALVLTMVAICLSFLAFCCFFVALLKADDHEKQWEAWRMAGVIAFLLVVPFQIGVTWLDEELSLVLHLAKTVQALAPLFPAGFAIYDVIEDAAKAKPKAK